MRDSSDRLFERVVLWTGFVILVLVAIVAFMLVIAGDVVGRAGGVALLWVVNSLLKTLRK